MRTVLTDDEWRQLSPLLAAASDDNDARRGRPRLDNDRRAAEACVFRHYHGLSPIYGTFGWNELPAVLSDFIADALRVLEHPSALVDSPFLAFGTIDFGTGVLLVSCPIALGIGAYLPLRIHRQLGE